MGYSPKGCKESDMTERLHFLSFFINRSENNSSMWSCGRKVAKMVKNLPAIKESWVQSLGQEDPLDKGMATHSSILAWRIPCGEEPGRLQSMRSHRVRHD